MVVLRPAAGIDTRRACRWPTGSRGLLPGMARGVERSHPAGWLPRVPVVGKNSITGSPQLLDFAASVLGHDNVILEQSHLLATSSPEELTSGVDEDLHTDYLDHNLLYRRDDVSLLRSPRSCTSQTWVRTMLRRTLCPRTKPETSSCFPLRERVNAHPALLRERDGDNGSGWLAVALGYAHFPPRIVVWGAQRTSHCPVFELRPRRLWVDGASADFRSMEIAGR